MSPLKRSARARSAGPAKPAQRRSRRGGPVWLRLLLILAVVALLLDILPAPWALDIGGQFSPLGEWDGFGPVQASNGGSYLLFTHLHGGITNGVDAHCSFRGCDTLTGTAQLCSASGRRYTFGLTGMVHTWLSTDGALTDLNLAGGTRSVSPGPTAPPRALPKGWVVAFHGTWQAHVLPLADTDGSFTRVFTPSGAIRAAASPAGTGTARVTLRPGSAASFDTECHNLANGIPLTRG
jgi:hypothetical protein